MRRIVVYPVLAVCLHILLYAGSALALKSEVLIIAQPDAPVRITNYEASYSTGITKQEGINHKVSYVNSGNEPIVALDFGLVSFDVWNEFLHAMGGVTIENLAPGEKGSGTWVAQPWRDFSFHTGVAFVSKVRFGDGSIWSADLDAVVAQMKKIQKGFDAANLVEKPKAP